MTDLSWWLTAALMGLLGGTHCVGMCGGLSAAFTYALPADQRQGWRLLGWQLLYNSGRLLTYVLLGLLAGSLLGWLQQLGPGKAILRLSAGLFMVLLGAYLAGWLQALAVLERLGQPLWRWLTPWRQRLFPISARWQAVAAGLVWGLLPCGLVYAAMALSATQGSPLASAGVMLAFGLGTLPTLLLTGTAAGQLRHLLQRPGTRQTAGALVILFGFWTLMGVFTGHGPGHASPTPAPAAAPLQPAQDHHHHLH